MKLIIILFCFVVFFFIIKEKSTKRFVWLIAGICLLSMDIKISISPPINAHTLFIIAYFISLLYHKEFNNYWKEFPLNFILLVLLFTHLMVGLMDERLNLISKLSRPIFIYAQTYFCIFIGYTSLKTLREWSTIPKTILVIFGIVGLYGIVTFLMQNNPYYDFINQLFSSSNEKGIWFEVQERGYRVLSTFNNPIPYGFTIGVVSLFAINHFFKTPNLFIVLILLVIASNIFLSNSRSAVVSFMMSIFIFTLLQLRFNFNWKYLARIFIFAISIIAFNMFIPAFKTSINDVTDIIKTGGEEVQGSNIELKQTQWERSLFYFTQSPVWGNGYYYFAENIYSYNKDPELAGLEGYAYKLAVEEGLLQIIAILAFFLLLFRHLFISWNKINNRYSCFSISALFTFVFFIVSVGTYGNVFVVTFLLLGLIIRYIELVNKKNEIFRPNSSL